MSTEDNKALMRRFFEEAWNRHDADKVAEFFAPVRHDARRGSEWVSAPVASYVRAVRNWCTAFPDIRIEIDKMVAEDDTVAVYFTCTGTHKGEFTLGGPTTPPDGPKEAAPSGAPRAARRR